MLAHQLHQNGIAIILEHFNLHQQAFLRRARSHPHGIKTLDGPDHRLHLGRAHPAEFGNFFITGAQISGGIQISNHQFADFLLLVAQGGKTKLPHQMGFQRGLGRVSGLQTADFLRKFILAG